MALSQPLHLMQQGSGLDTDFDGIIRHIHSILPIQNPCNVSNQFIPYQLVSSIYSYKSTCFPATAVVVTSFHQPSQHLLSNPFLPPLFLLYLSMHTYGSGLSAPPLASVNSGPFNGHLGRRPQVTPHPTSRLVAYFSRYPRDLVCRHYSTHPHTFNPTSESIFVIYPYNPPSQSIHPLSPLLQSANASVRPASASATARHGSSHSNQTSSSSAIPGHNHGMTGHYRLSYLILSLSLPALISPYSTRPYPTLFILFSSV